jgi:hypothetical protein
LDEVFPPLIVEGQAVIRLRLIGVSLAQLVGGVDVQTQHLGSNPHGREFRFLFVLKDQALLVLMQFILRTRLDILSRLKILILMLKKLCASLVGAEAGEVKFSPNFKKISLGWLSR